VPNDVADADVRRSFRAGLGVASIVLAVVVVDQITKWWAVEHLARAPISLIGTTVELHLTRNAGGAFSLLSGFTPFLAVAAIALAVLLVGAVRRTSDRWMLVGLALLLGGALGNLIDRLVRSPGVMRGEVVDFIAVWRWPVFNVADSCVTIGAIVLVIATFRSPRRPAVAP